MAEYKILHIYDIITCNNGGMADLINKVKEHRTEVQDTLRIVTDQDLLKRVKIYRCSLKCTKVASITTGLAKDVVLKDDEIPILANFEGVSDKGCTVKADPSLAAQLTMAEKRAKTVYDDTEGHPTVGIGFNLDKSTAADKLADQGLTLDEVKNGKELTDAQIDGLFAGDTADAEDAVKKSIPNFDTFTDTQKKALTDMAFNLGGFSEWPKFVAAVNRGDWAGAAKEAGTAADGHSPSHWVTQVGDRAKRIIAQLRGDENYATSQ